MPRLGGHQQHFRITRVLDDVVNDVAEKLRGADAKRSPTRVRTEREYAFSGSNPQRVRHGRSIASAVNRRQPMVFGRRGGTTRCCRNACVGTPLLRRSRLRTTSSCSATGVVNVSGNSSPLNLAAIWRCSSTRSVDGPALEEVQIK